MAEPDTMFLIVRDFWRCVTQLVEAELRIVGEAVYGWMVANLTSPLPPAVARKLPSRAGRAGGARPHRRARERRGVRGGHRAIFGVMCAARVVPATAQVAECSDLGWTRRRSERSALRAARHTSSDTR